MRLPTRPSVVAIAMLVGAAFASCSQPEPMQTESTGGAVGEREVVFPEQGWTAAERQEFYYLSQGSRLVPYDWFLALEQADDTELFRSDSHLERFGYIVSEPDSRWNPDGLPIGFVRDGSPDRDGVSWLGLTCSACHTTFLEHSDVALRIDGGPAMVDHETFLASLATAFRSTLSDQDKLGRFMTRLSSTGNDSDAGEVLVTRLRAHTALLESEVEINRADYPYGFARLDAFGAILNRVASTSLAIPENAAMSNAPVSYPFLWDAPALDWVQWNGSAANPIERNVGEVLGTYAHFTLTDTPPSQQFESTANIRNLFRLEQLVAQLAAPAWPDELFGRPDPEKVELGRQLYANRCSRCHRLRDEDGNFALTEPNQAGRRFIRTTMASVGTDEQMVTNFARLAAPGPLRPLLPPAVRDNPRVPAALLLSVAVQGVLARKLRESQPPFDEAELAALNGYRDPDIRPPNPAAYKARPHNGIWATAPFLHNGSVPNLYQLLLPENERVQSFYVGNRQFDPVQVGFQTEPFAGGFEFRTRTPDGQPIPGNSNAGHSGRNHTQVDVGDGTFRDFTDDERWALVEYLKTVN